VQILIGKTGKLGLKRRVSEFKVENLAIEIAVRVRTILAPFELDEVRDVSAGAATFYVWVSHLNTIAKLKIVLMGILFS